MGVIRGAVVSHPRYAGRRIFGAGLNLTHLYHGQLDFLFFITRDLGYVNKLFRGLSSEEHLPGEPEQTTEKLWVAAVEAFAIGGACQILHTVDHVIAMRGARLYLPARKEGILPGASNLRLPRAVGERLARQAILSGLEFEAGTPHGDLLCDEVVDSTDEMDAAIARRMEALTSSGLVNAAGNRRALRVGPSRSTSFGNTWPRSVASRSTATSAPHSSATSNSTGTHTSAAAEPVIWSPAEQLSRSGAARAPARAPSGDVRRRARLARAPAVQRQGRPARRLSVRAAARARLVARPPARVERDARQADGRRLHRSRPRSLDRADGPLHDAGRRSPRDARAQREHVRALHRWPRVPSGRRADRRPGCAGLGRDDGTPGDAPARPR